MLVICFNAADTNICIMSYLRTNLQRPGESLLSILFNAGDAGDTFQKRILGHLNAQDRRNMRSTHRRLRDVLRGRQCVMTRRNARGEIEVVRTHDGRPNIANSTILWLGGRCYGKRLPSYRDCDVSPRSNVRVANCTGILRVSGLAPSYLPYYKSVCPYCVVSVANILHADEDRLLQRSCKARLCRHCELFQLTRNPNGLNTCDCRRLITDGWKCWVCRGEIFTQFQRKYSIAHYVLRDTHRTRDGKMVYKPRSRPQRFLPCPGCGRSNVDRKPNVNHSVTYCLICKGLEVAPTLGPAYQPTPLIPQQPTRRSARIAAQYAEAPGQSFVPSTP